MRGRGSAGLAERHDVSVNFQWFVRHYQLKMGARLGVAFHFRLHEHRATYLRIEIVTRHRDMVDLDGETCADDE